jgi:hypothetical protein
VVDRLRKEEFFYNKFEKDERGLIGWKITKKSKDEDSGSTSTQDEILYTEELVAIMLKFGRQLSEK